MVAFEPRVLIPGFNRELHQVCWCHRWGGGGVVQHYVTWLGKRMCCIGRCWMPEMPQVNGHLLRPMGCWSVPKKWSELCWSSLQGSSFLMSWWLVLGEEWDTFHRKLLAECFCKATGLCRTSTALDELPLLIPYCCTQHQWSRPSWNCLPGNKRAYPCRTWRRKGGKVLWDLCPS